MERPERVGAMAPSKDLAGPAKRRLIINADDFGLSSEVNEAVIRAHTEGVLTSASLMVNEDGFDEAVALAHRHPNLGVGLHLSLVCGRSALPAERVPGLVNRAGHFTRNPVTAGMNYFFRPSLRQELVAEIEAQFERFRSTGLRLDHVNGHLHFHLHPAILPIVVPIALRCGACAMRLTHDPLWLNAIAARGKWSYRMSHAAIFKALRHRARAALQQSGLRHTHYVFGLLQDSRVDEEFILRLLPRLPHGDSELYSHPSLTQFRHELEALLSPKVKTLIANLGIDLIRYQDL